jgi:hypothetical protein
VLAGRIAPKSPSADMADGVDGLDSGAPDLSDAPAD